MFRKDKIKELMEKLEKGPDTFQAFPDTLKTYRSWASCWIIPLVKELIPELKKEAKEKRLKEKGY